MRNLKLLILLTFFAFLLHSCTQPKKLSKYNLAHTYAEDFPGKIMQEQIFHLNDSISELAIKIDASKIPGLRKSQLDAYSLMLVNYAVYSSLNKSDLIQSDSYKLSDLVPYDTLKFASSEVIIPLHLLENQSYHIVLSIKDQVNKRNFEKILRVDKNADSPENFRVIDENNKIVWFPWLEKDKKIKIVYRYPEANMVYLSYFEPKFSPAMPPYASIPKIANEMPQRFEKFDISLKNGVSQIMQLPKEGVYKIHAKVDQIRGKMLVQFYEGYPSLENDAQKVFVLRYLNARKEFSAMLQDDPTHTIQEFWFFEGRAKDRSQEMQRTYYARAQRANELFSSYKEGWKTDRGMIFMVYGPPDNVFYQEDREVWEYGSAAEYNDLRFDFMMSNTPLNHQEYILNRQDDYKDSWHLVVENWRDKE